jgi:zinc transport system substrate-binding protein
MEIINMRKYFIIIFLLLLTGNLYSKPSIVVTSHPLKAIMVEIVGNRIDISTLVPPGASPHTFSPKPSDAYKVQKSLALFYVSSELDGWATGMSGKEIVKVIDFLPNDYKYLFDDKEHDTKGTKHNHGKGVVDPHFWTDPLAVKAILPKLVDKICMLDPSNAKEYRKNSADFAKKLDIFNGQIVQKLSVIKGQSIFLFHPSFRYFLRRYGLVYAGSIEPAPGKEPSVKYISGLADKIKKSKTKALFTEPQLPEKPAKALAEASKLKIYTLDPIGGLPGGDSYIDMMNYNTDIFYKALK